MIFFALNREGVSFTLERLCLVGHSVRYETEFVSIACVVGSRADRTDRGRQRRRQDGGRVRDSWTQP